MDRCYATAGLLEALCSLAADREPASVSVLLAVTPAGAFDGAAGAFDGAASPFDGAADGVPGRTASAAVVDLDPRTPVFTDFYLPTERRSVDAVFGVDVSVPHGQAQGRFVSHPLGDRDVSTTDDLHEVVLVAVPPWRLDDVAAFDRSGRRLELHVVEDVPPEPPFEG